MTEKVIKNRDSAAEWKELPGADPDIRSMYLPELKRLMEELGEKPFRAKQLFEWLHEKRVESYDEMTSLSGALREKLKERYPLHTLEVVNMQESRIDGTRKYLFALHDGNVIESVWMKYKHGNSVCISSQAGCRMGCRFCASTLDGLVRSLQASEMLEQIYRIQQLTGERVSNVVVMGSGEPLDNYNNILRFVYLASMQNGLGISQRNLTVSTCGIVPRIYDLADEELAITLAISLHAPDDEKRREMMPIANRYTIEELLDACRYYFDKTGRRLTFEYALAADANDAEADAERLGRLLKGLNCHVNLIPINPVKERKYGRSAKKVVLNFQNKLEKCGINVTIRREMGSDIDGACGQLRKSYLDKSGE
ncbi:MAG: 23S rRNA (adenine(2503)-C(2))-methyltransferase RlmN [Lachnospiraceae bacterium]|nr:23S rRNA (adenine(2503)-C(2))-methyltransferase RlmN [Lachnospiraceae bacterium]